MKNNKDKKNNLSKLFSFFFITGLYICGFYISGFASSGFESSRLTSSVVIHPRVVIHPKNGFVVKAKDQDFLDELF